MFLGVDIRSNALIVSASDENFDEIRRIAGELDLAYRSSTFTREQFRDRVIVAAEFTLWPDDTGSNPVGFAPADMMGDSTDFEVVPEPATLMLLGLGGIALLRRRRS